MLQDRDVEVDIVQYLQDAPSADEIRGLLSRLELNAADIVRTSEPAFKESGLTRESPAEELIALLAEHPIVLQRPIVVVGESARIGRPPEQVLELLP